MQCLRSPVCVGSKIAVVKIIRVGEKYLLDSRNAVDCSPGLYRAARPFIADSISSSELSLNESASARAALAKASRISSAPSACWIAAYGRRFWVSSRTVTFPIAA